MKRTYIPKLLRMVQEMAWYLTIHQQHMGVAAGLTEEQKQALSDLATALRNVQTLLGPLVPLPEPRARRKVDLWPVDFRAMHAQQQGRCHYCGYKLFPYGIWPRSTKFDGARRYQIDHRVPVSRGGTDVPENLCLACVDCNQHKGMLTEAEYRAVLVARNAGAGAGAR